MVQFELGVDFIVIVVCCLLARYVDTVDGGWLMKSLRVRAKLAYKLQGPIRPPAVEDFLRLLIGGKV
jgi:hypothetical protein